MCASSMLLNVAWVMAVPLSTTAYVPRTIKMLDYDTGTGMTYDRHTEYLFG
jgi:hypothetical protein